MNSLAQIGRVRRELIFLSPPICTYLLLLLLGFLLTLVTASLRATGLVKQLERRAWISRSAAMPATAIERQSESSSALTASGKARREVPLPSQEKKEGAMQYAL